MKKNGSMQGTLSKLFGKKNSNTNSLYLENPPWIKPQGVKKTSVDYHDDIHNTFSFLDDSGTATLKARPGPRVRPMLQFSTSHTETQGLAVPTPSVPSGYSESSSIGNGPKLNGNYRMYSSVGDLHLTNYYENREEEIPAPPSMPPPPPPSMMLPAPPQESPHSSTVSSPSSPNPPDFIPPAPNSYVPMVLNFLPQTDTSTAPTDYELQSNVSKWKSETVLNAGSKDMPMGLPNRFSLNIPGFQNSRGQTILESDSQSTLPKSFKVPPPAPTRTSSIQLQEHQDISYPKETPQSKVQSSFNPNVQAKLFSVQGQKLLNEELNKRKSVIIMEDLQDLSQKLEHSLQNSVSVASGSLSLKSPTESNVESNNEDDLRAKINRAGNQNEVSKHSLSNFESNKMYKDGDLPNGLKSLKHKVQPLRPILTDQSMANIPVQDKQNSLSRKEMNRFPKELERMEDKLKLNQAEGASEIRDTFPSPPMVPPPPPPMPPPPIPVAITPTKTSSMTLPPASPQIIRTSPAPPASPLLSPKPKIIPTSLTPPKAPPLPPPLPSPLTHTLPLSPEPHIPLMKALQEKQQTLKPIPKKSIEIRPAQISVFSEDDQKVRVGKIKGELEALFSPKKDQKIGELKTVRPETNKKNLEAIKKNETATQVKSGENTLVNSLMLKVPLMPVKQEKEDVDGDNSDWIPKSNKANLEIPDPDYQPKSPIKDFEKLNYSNMQTRLAKSMAEPSLKSAPFPKVTDVQSTLNDIPAYKPHNDRKTLTESLTLDTPLLNVSESTAFVPKDQETTSTFVKSESVLNENKSFNELPDTGNPSETTSPMALLMAAKKRAQKGSRSVFSEHGTNLPKISVSNGIVRSSFSSECNEKANTFVVVPKKENFGNFSQEEVTSFNSRPSNNLDQVAFKSRWTDGELHSSTVGPTSQKSDDEKASRIMHVRNKSFGESLPEDRNLNFWNSKSPVVENNAFTNMSNFIDGPTFNISAVPSPIPASKKDQMIDYGIIPPPAEFMNSPRSSDVNVLQEKATDHNTKSDLIPSYEWNNRSLISQPIISSSSDLDKYTRDDYSTGINRDPQKSSLIKKRLYMPDPESTSSYGKSANSLRTPAYSHVHIPSSSNMAPEQWRSSNPTRYLTQGRRVSSENLRVVPPITDLKYKTQSSDYSVGKPSSKSQNAYQQGMTFTVRPGTRQPITQTYQGGYL